MPTMILALACFLATMPRDPVPAPAAPGPSVAVPAICSHGQPIWLGTTSPDLGELGWLLDESETDDDRETDDDLASKAESLRWAKSPMPFTVAVVNPHPTILPRSALRSPILRC